MLDPETERIFNERYEAKYTPGESGLPQDGRGNQDFQLAARGVLSSGMAISELTGLYRKEVKDRSERAFALLKEVVHDLDAGSPTLAGDMKSLLKAKIEEQLAELNSQCLRDAGGARLATEWPLQLKSEADNAVRSFSARTDQFVAAVRRVERTEQRRAAGSGGPSEERDVVTNLLKRGALEVSLPVEFAAAVSAGSPLCVVMVDIDR